MSRRLRIAMAVAGTIWLVPLAQAQTFDTGPAALARQMPSIYAPYLANMSRLRLLENRRKLGAPEAPAPASAAVTTFRPVQAAFVPRLLAARLGKTPEKRRTIETTLAQCLTHYTDIARQKGVPLYDVARALGYFIATNYFVYTQGAGPTLPQISATQKILRANIGADDTFRHMTARQKQEAYETLIVLAGFADLGYGTMKQAGNEAGAAQFRAFAKQSLENLLGVPVEKLRFTDDGLELD